MDFQAECRAAQQGRECAFRTVAVVSPLGVVSAVTIARGEVSAFCGTLWCPGVLVACPGSNGSCCAVSPLGDVAGVGWRYGVVIADLVLE